MNTSQPNPFCVAPPRTELEAQVLREQVSLVFATIRTATWADSALAMAFGVAMYWQTQSWAVLVWMALHVYNTSRVRRLTAYFKDPAAAQRPAHWANVYCREFCMNSFTWGLAPLLFLPESLPLKALMMLVMLGLCTSGVLVVSPLALAIRYYILPMILCLTAALLLRFDAMDLFLAGCCVIFMPSVLRLANAQNRLLAGSLRSRFEKEALARRLEEQVRATEEASQEKTRFLAAASHDLRQPMHAIALLGSTLERQLADSPAQTNARRLMQAVSALSHSLDSMLDISRLDAGVVQSERQPVELQALFQSLNESFVSAANEKDIQLRLRSTRLWVLSDPQLLRRLLSNLMDNAIKYTRRGGVLVVPPRRAAGPSESTVWIEIHDTGIGIDPDQQPRIYEEFFQISNPGRDRALGLGIGLSIVARLARLLEHPIELRSSAGRGSRFRLRLAETQPLAATESALAAYPAATQAAPGLPRRVLVLDDEADVRHAMEQLLRSHGIEAESAGNEAEAAAALEKAAAASAPFSLLICDFRLAQGVDGLQIGQALSRRHANLPLLLVTGETAPHRLLHVRDAGVPVLFKPVTSERLLQAMATTVC